MTISNAVRHDLGMASRVRPPRQLIADKQKELRLERCKKLVCDLKRRSTVRLFSNKKNFTVDQAYNRRNDRFISSEAASVIPVNRTKHPVHVMMLGVIASNGKKMPPVFIPQGLKVNQHVYMDILKTRVKPWIDEEFPGVPVTWQQDGAPAHTAKLTQTWLEENLPGYWDKNMWPPSSPDLNPLDYSIWSMVEREACATPHRNLEDLKASIVSAWDNMSEDYIRKTCAAFRPRLERVIAAGGGLIE